MQVIRKTVSCGRCCNVKLHSPSSVAVIGMSRSPHSAQQRPAWPETVAISMQMCRKYARPAQSQLKVCDISDTDK